MKTNENVNIMGLDAVISYDNEIPGSRELAILEHVQQAAKMAPDLGAKVAGIEVLAKTCTKTSALVGETITLKASGSSGTAPYIIVFKKDGVELTRFTGVPAGTEKTYAYTIVAEDVGTKAFSVDLSDSCPGAQKTCSESCSITVSTACPLPACSFTVQ